MENAKTNINTAEGRNNTKCDRGNRSIPIVGKYGWYDYFDPAKGVRSPKNSTNNVSNSGTVVRTESVANTFVVFTDNLYLYSNTVWDAIASHAPEFPEITPEGIFGNTNKTVLEVGIGNGEFLINMAENNPDVNYIGFEVFKEGATKCIRRCKAKGLTNVRVVHFDAIFFMHLLAKSTIVEVYVNFPDPWFKQRHRKRRIINPQLVRLIATLLEPNGVLNIATDNEDYATGTDGMQQVLEQCEAEGVLANMQAEPFTHDDSHYFSTKYYRKFGRERSYFFKYTKKAK